MGRKKADGESLDAIFGGLARHRPADAAQRPSKAVGLTAGGGRARSPTTPLASGDAPRGRPNPPAMPALSAGSGNAFQRRADEGLPAKGAGPSANPPAAGKRKRARPADGGGSIPAHRERESTEREAPAHPAQPRSAGRELGLPVDISDAALAQAANGGLLRALSAPAPSAAAVSANNPPPTLGAAGARLVLLSGVRLAGPPAERKAALDALLAQLAPLAPLHAHSVARWEEGGPKQPRGAAGGTDAAALAAGAGGALPMLALELGGPAAAALLLAAAERLAGSRLAPTRVDASAAEPPRLAAARALLRAHPTVSVGDSCAALCAQAHAVLAAAAADRSLAQLGAAASGAGSGTLLELAISASSAAEARALVALAAESAATAKGGGGDAAGACSQLARLCARHRQGKAAACAGIATQAVASAAHVSLGAASFSLSYCGKVRARPLPAAPALALLALLEAHDWESTGNNRNPTGRREGIQVDGAFSLGVGTARLPPAAAACPGGALSASAPFGVPCAFREGVGVQRGDAARRRHSALWAAALELLRAIDPLYAPTSIGFNRNFRGSPHRDEKDAGPQVATALSAALRGGRGYQGGALRVYSPHGAVDVDTQNGWCRFDGRYRHEVMPFRAAAAAPGKARAGGGPERGADGVRYSVIYYQLMPPFAVDMSSVQPPA